MTAEKILFVDDEPRILQAYQRSLKKEFSIDIAVGAADGLIVLASQGPYAVIISDQQMPGINGLQFLAKARERSPESVRVMLTGNSDQQTAIDALNQGNIFRFLTKPCSLTELAKTITDAMDQHRLIVAERELLGQTLNGSVQILTEILSLINPVAFGCASRIRRMVKQIAVVLKVENAWQVEIAAMLSQASGVPFSIASGLGLRGADRSRRGRGSRRDRRGGTGDPTSACARAWRSTLPPGPGPCLPPPGRTSRARHRSPCPG